MRVLVIGQGGREHALCHKISKSPLCEKLYCAPGNGGTAQIAENISIQAEDISALVHFAKQNRIDITVVGPEVPLALGIVDEFQKESLRIFGPDRSCARLESSKAFTKDFLMKYHIPTARYVSVTTFEEGMEALRQFTYPVVVKADGLCAGKGVVIAENKEEAVSALKEMMVENRFGEEGHQVVLEEFLKGFEASIFCFVSKGRLFPMVSAKDYKKIGEGDTGLNTGGVGAFSPNILLTEEHRKQIYEKIIPKIEEGLIREGLLFDGILFIGFMIDGEGAKILEFNARFGDPETQVVLQKLDSDLLELLHKAVEGNLQKQDFYYNNLQWMTVILTSKGYPGNYEKVKLITFSDIIDSEILILHNGTVQKDDKLFTDGGRVLSICAGGETLEVCREKIYRAIKGISFEGLTYRKDIGCV